ncbi:MAG TPA: hypothetical protein P5556_04840 [Candidatus Gastranaerophilales bacterium]|nr:hypothetical protein [Candidatus Gastranaerophilales bacterium]
MLINGAQNSFNATQNKTPAFKGFVSVSPSVAKFFSPSVLNQIEKRTPPEASTHIYPRVELILTPPSRQTPFDVKIVKELDLIAIKDASENPVGAKQLIPEEAGKFTLLRAVSNYLKSFEKKVPIPDETQAPKVAKKVLEEIA